MNVTQASNKHVIPPPSEPKKPTRAEIQRRYRENVQRRLEALKKIEQVIADLQGVSND